MGPTRNDRRRFIKQVAGLGGTALAAPPRAGAQPDGRIAAFDHVAVPMRDTDAMVAFYRRLGFEVREGERICSVHLAHQKINFHRPALWETGSFELRAPAAVPPCGDFCFVWEGTLDSLRQRLRAAEAGIVEGPVERQGGRDGGEAVGTSLYVRDPDGNLLEFIVY